jgi:hypothetical protein
LKIFVQPAVRWFADFQTSSIGRRLPVFLILHLIPAVSADLRQFPDFGLFYSGIGSSRALIQGVTMSSAMREFGHSCERPVCPPSGFTQDHFAEPPDCISM